MPRLLVDHPSVSWKKARTSATRPHPKRRLDPTSDTEPSHISPPSLCASRKDTPEKPLRKAGCPLSVIKGWIWVGASLLHHVVPTSYTETLPVANPLRSFLVHDAGVTLQSFRFSARVQSRCPRRRGGGGRGAQDSSFHVPTRSIRSIPPRLLFAIPTRAQRASQVRLGSGARARKAVGVERCDACCYSEDWYRTSEDGGRLPRPELIPSSIKGKA